MAAATNKKFAGLLILLLIGVGVGWGLGSLVSFDKWQVSADAKAVAEKFYVQVVDTGEEFTFTLDDPLTKVIFWQTGGVQLQAYKRREKAWQLVLGQEDWPENSGGDSADVIVKITKWLDGSLAFEVACLGGYTKRVYYDNQLKLDTSTGTRYATWTS